jgi:GTPase Era involved in 16S rRNA processing
MVNNLMSDEYANWSRKGAEALVEYLEQMEEDCGFEIEFDRVAIRCDFSEYSSLLDFAEEYFADKEQMFSEACIDADSDEDDIDEAIREYIQDHGQLIEFDGGIIVSSF